MTVVRDYLFPGRAGSRMAQLSIDRLKLVKIREAICIRFGVSEAELDGRSCRGEIVDARHAAMFLAKKMTDLSYPRIGRVFGGRDHSSVMHACEKMEWYYTHNSSIGDVLRELAQQVREAA